MQLIDFTNLDQQYLNSSMADIGVKDFNNLSLLTILKQLNLGSDKTTKECFPIQDFDNKVNISSTIRILKQEKKIVDSIGPIEVPLNIPIYFLTLIGLKPKKYLYQYTEVVKILSGILSNSRFIVWLEDTLTILKNNWDDLTMQKSIEKYKNFLNKKGLKHKILLSSKVAPIGIPREFIEKLKKITFNEFLSVIPFHRRSPILIKVMDIVHFIWNCYVLYRLPGIHLGGINNKRHFQLFRKIIGQQITVILLPLCSERFINEKTP